MTVLLGFSPLACTDAPLGPGQGAGLEASKPDVGPSLLSSSTSGDGSTVTIVDDYGMAYTLDIPRRQLRRGSESLPLTAEQTEMLAAAYRGTVALDPTADELAGVQPPPQEPPPEEGCFDWYQSRCPAAESWDGVGAESATYAMSVRHSLANGTYETLLSGDGGAAMSVSSGPSTASYGDVCTDVANAAVATVSNYRTVRNSLGEDIWSAVKDAAMGVAGAVTDFMYVVADHYYARIAVGTLAGYWTTYNCGSKHVTAGTVFKTRDGYRYGNPGTGGGMAMACTYESWEISFDGGQTWHRVSVRVCEVAIE